MSLPALPFRASLPAPPRSTLAFPLPLITLSRALPVPLILAAPVRVRLRTPSASVVFTLLLWLSWLLRGVGVLGGAGWLPPRGSCVKRGSPPGMPPSGPGSVTPAPLLPPKVLRPLLPPLTFSPPGLPGCPSRLRPLMDPWFTAMLPLLPTTAMPPSSTGVASPLPPLLVGWPARAARRWLRIAPLRTETCTPWLSGSGMLTLPP